MDGNQEFTPAPMGHNVDPLDVEALKASIEIDNEDFFKQIGEFLEGAKTWTKCAGEEDAKQITDAAKILQEAKKEAEKRRKDLKEPYDAAGKAVQDIFKTGQIDPLDAEIKRLRAVYGVWQAKEKERKQKEAEKLRDQAEKAIAEAVTDEDHDAAMKLAAAAKKAGSPVRTKTDFGAGASQTKRWTFEVTNKAEVPPAYMMVDSAKVREAISNNIRDIPGLRIFEAEGTSFN